MALVIIGSQPADGDVAEAEDINDQIDAILAQVNGNLDDTNIISMNGSKIVANSLPPTAFSPTTNLGWLAVPNTLTYGANNGNKEFTVTAAADLTAILSPGMKYRHTRAVTPPTESMLFVAASSQYATKASPAGINFTGAFTAETWIYLNSYPTSSAEWQILNRRNSTFNGGWGFSVQTNGTIRIYYGTSTSITDFVSYQSIPLRTWVHVAGVVSSVSSKTGQIYINGTAVPTTSSLTAATTLTQSTDDLRMGAIGGGTLTNTYLDAVLSETRLWATNQTQSAIELNMGINLVGTETNLIGLWQGNGVFTDANSNANTLTATGGAIATNVANPYNPIEYGIITKVSYSNPTSTVTISMAGTIPNQTLNTPQYSTADAPFGLSHSLHPVGRRLLYVPINTLLTNSGGSTPATFPPINALTFTVPQNCGKVYICGFQTAFASSSASGVAVMTFYNGSVSPANLIGQTNSATTNSYWAPRIPVSVVPGSTFSLTMQYSSSAAGNASWAAATIDNENAVWVET